MHDSAPALRRFPPPSPRPPRAWRDSAGPRRAYRQPGPGEQEKVRKVRKVREKMRQKLSLGMQRGMRRRKENFSYEYPLWTSFRIKTGRAMTRQSAQLPCNRSNDVNRKAGCQRGADAGRCAPRRTYRLACAIEPARRYQRGWCHGSEGDCHPHEMSLSMSAVRAAHAITARRHRTTGLSGSSFRPAPLAGKCFSRCCVTARMPLTTPPS